MKHICPCGQPAKKVNCVCEPAPYLCHWCSDSHRCPSLANVDAKAWKKANAPEEALTTAVIADLNATVAGLTCWRTKRKQGARASDQNDGVLDISGICAPDGIGVYVETKGKHKDGCGCDSCAAQRDFAARVNGAGGVAVLGVRDVMQARAFVVSMLEARRKGRAA